MWRGTTKLDQAKSHLLIFGCESSVGCEPLRDRVDQPDIRRYISVQLNSYSDSEKHSMQTHKMKRLANFPCLTNSTLSELHPLLHSYIKTLGTKYAI